MYDNAIVEVINDKFNLKAILLITVHSEQDLIMLR